MELPAEQLEYVINNYADKDRGEMCKEIKIPNHSYLFYVLILMAFTPLCTSLQLQAELSAIVLC